MDLELLAVTGPGGTGLVHRSLESEDVARAVVDDPDLRVEQRPALAGVERVAGVIERQGNPHHQQPGCHHPGQRPVAVAGDLVRLGPPAPRQAQPLALGIGRLQPHARRPFKALLQQVEPPTVRLDVLKAPGGTSDQSHRRPIGRRALVARWR